MTPPISVQLYSLREEAKQGLAPILERLGRIGYVGVESAGLHDLTPAAFKRCLADAGLVVSSGHVALPKPEGTAEVLDLQEAIGNKDLVVAFLPPDKFADADGVRTCAERLNAFNEKARARGMSLGYHNHWWEFSNRIGNETAHAMLFRLLDPTCLRRSIRTGPKSAASIRRGVVRDLGDRAPSVAHQGRSGDGSRSADGRGRRRRNRRGGDREGESREVARRRTRSVRHRHVRGGREEPPLPDQPRSRRGPGVARVERSRNACRHRRLRRDREGLCRQTQRAAVHRSGRVRRLESERATDVRRRARHSARTVGRRGARRSRHRRGREPHHSASARRRQPRGARGRQGDVQREAARR